MEENIINYDENFNIKNSKDMNEFVMPNLDAISKVIFATHFIAFVKEIVKHSILAVYKYCSENSEQKSKSIEAVIKIIRDGNIIFETAIKYVNQTWLNYHKKIEISMNCKIEIMKKKGNFLHTSCLFSYIWHFCQMILIYTLGRIDVSELRDVEFLGDSIDIITDGIMSYHVDTINNREFACNDYCEVYEFNEKEEFINIKKK